MADNTQISVRLDPAVIRALEEVGKAMKPLPLNRTDMITIAINEYLERNKPAKKKGKG